MTARRARNWQYDAFDRTVEIAVTRKMPILDGPLGLNHIVGMRDRLQPGFVADKLGRWLGWAQAGVAGSGVSTLDEMMELNRGLAPTPSAELDRSAEALYEYVRAMGIHGPNAKTWSEQSEAHRDLWRGAIRAAMA